MQFNKFIVAVVWAFIVTWPFITLAKPEATELYTTSSASAVFITVKGAIGPATLDYVERSLQKAIEKRASLFIIKMDTPGGLDNSMREIIKLILSSPIPVATYVTPGGARAASAGTYILYASHIAAMTPATNLGAATPVQIAAPSNPLPAKPGEDPDKAKKDPPAPAGSNDAMRHKVVNDAAAYIIGLAELRGRNKEWAERAVREAVSLPAEQALEKNVIDLVATDIGDLLKQINGKTIKVNDQDVTLNTQGMLMEELQPDWRNQLLSIITDPNVAYILMLVGIYGLIFEFTNPGAVLPGVMGGISILLALYAFQVLPVNYAGFGLILLGVILMVAEAFAPSFGALGFGGVVAFVIGSIILMDTEAPGFGVSLPLIGSVAFVSSALFAFVLVMAVRSRKRPVVSGQEQMLGAVAQVVDDFSEHGRVFVHGETWNAISASPLRKGQYVIVVKMEGLTLTVSPQSNQ